MEKKRGPAVLLLIPLLAVLAASSRAGQNMRTVDFITVMGAGACLGVTVMALVQMVRGRKKPSACNRVKSRLIAILALVALCLPASAFARQKTDLVFIGKADRITGEIKQMDRGILKVSTNNIGTVNVEWEDVDSLNSVYQFRVEDRLGRKHFGAIFMTKALVLQVIQGGQTETVAAMDVVSITPLEASFWQRIDGSIAIGFS